MNDFSRCKSYNEEERVAGQEWVTVFALEWEKGKACLNTNGEKTVQRLTLSERDNMQHFKMRSHKFCSVPEYNKGNSLGFKSEEATSNFCCQFLV